MSVTRDPVVCVRDQGILSYVSVTRDPVVEPCPVLGLQPGDPVEPFRLGRRGSSQGMLSILSEPLWVSDTAAALGLRNAEFKSFAGV